MPLPAEGDACVRRKQFDLQPWLRGHHRSLGNGDVDFAGQQSRHEFTPLPLDDLDANRRVLRGQPCRCLEHADLERVGAGTDRQLPGAKPAELLQLLTQLLLLGKQVGRVRQEHPALRGRFYSPPRAIEKPDAEVRFQRCDVTAERRLSDPDRGCGTGEIPVLVEQ